jgi:DNA-binding beta-propeller fold protein YncE
MLMIFARTAFRGESMKTTIRIFALVIAASFSIVLGPNSTFLRKAQAAPPQGTEVPKFEIDPSWPKPLPEFMVTGEVGGTCIDAQDHVFVLNRDNLTPDEQRNSLPAPPVIEFDPDGNIVNSWGKRIIRDADGNSLTRGAQDTLPKRLHSCVVDDQGNVWIGGNQDGIIQKYTHDGSKLLLQIGVSGHPDTSDGTPSGYAMNSSKTTLNRPAAMAIDPANGDVYVADGYGNRRVAVFDRDGHFLRQWGQQGTVAQTESGVGSVFLDTVHCVAFDNAGLVYVCDRKGDRVEVFDKMGNFKKNIYIQKGTGYVRGLAGSAWWVAFSRDPAQKYMYVADGGNEVVWVLDHATGQILSGIGRPGHWPGEFTYLHTLSIDSKGNLIAAETINGRRVQRFKMTGFGPAGKLPRVRSGETDSQAAPGQPKPLD